MNPTYFVEEKRSTSKFQSSVNKDPNDDDK